MTLSPQQDTCLRAVDYWYKNERHEKQVFYIAGYAGSGKTTLAKHFAANIDGTVKFATFTGKAAMVLIQKGCHGATTVHRLIYRPKITSKARLIDLEIQLASLKSQPTPDEDAIDRVTEEINLERENIGRMNFSLNLESDLRFAKLLIIDEVSMINAQLGKDLESFNVPILVLGDPEQLPPVYGCGYFTDRKPDFFLSEIHRQSLDNPIIAMSKIIREGGSLAVGTYGSSRVISSRMEAEEILKHDIMLTGLVRTKNACNTKAREVLGKTDPFPMKGDKVICIRNNYPMGLLNGQIFTCLSEAMDVDEFSVSLHIKDDDDLAVCAWKKLFLGQSLDRWEHEDDIQEFEYAYAITVHKAQGSQWNRVLLIDQKDKFPMWTHVDRRRWLYTGITRAAESVTVMRL